MATPVSGGRSLNATKPKPRIAVICLFLDKRHGSERIMIEWLAHLPDAFDIHIYSQRVEDLDPSKFTWHRVSPLPGPHLLNFLWWLFASRVRLNWDQRFRGMHYDLIFSSGAEWPGADAICIHIVFAEYVRRMKKSLQLMRTVFWEWPEIVHRKIYYALAKNLERRAYTNPSTTLIAHSSKTAREVEQLYGARDSIPVIYLGIDHATFNPERRTSLRTNARAALGIVPHEFALVLVGNDWRNKGVPVLLEALAILRDLPVILLVVTREDVSVCRDRLRERQLESRVRFLPPRSDIDFYYAAADAYAGPSVQDSYSMPPAEAMACGLPVIVSASAGVSEMVTDGFDGLILENPADAQALAAMIQLLSQDQAFAARLGENAHKTAQRYTWESNGRELAGIFEEILRRKSGRATHSLPQEL